MADRIIQNIAGHIAYPGELYRLTWDLEGENIIGVGEWPEYKDATYKRFHPDNVEIIRVTGIIPRIIAIKQVVMDVRFLRNMRLIQAFPETVFRPEGANMHLTEVLFIESGTLPPAPGSLAAGLEMAGETITETAEVVGEAVGAGIGGVISEVSQAVSFKLVIIGLLIVGGIWGVSQILD